MRPVFIFLNGHLYDGRGQEASAVVLFSKK